VMDQPILRNHELEKLRQVSHDVFDAATLDITWPVEQGPSGIEPRLQALCEEAARYVDNGANILILSDRNLGPERVAMPSLLAVAAVHHHLVRRGTRLRTGLVIESGEPRDIHHMATLIGYGAAAINPYLMVEALDELADRRRGDRAAVDRGAGAPLPRLSADRARPVARRWRASVAPRRRAAHLESRHDRQAPARGPQRLADESEQSELVRRRSPRDLSR